VATGDSTAEVLNTFPKSKLLWTLSYSCKLQTCNAVKEASSRVLNYIQLLISAFPYTHIQYIRYIRIYSCSRRRNTRFLTASRSFAAGIFECVGIPNSSPFIKITKTLQWALGNSDKAMALRKMNASSMYICKYARIRH